MKFVEEAYLDGYVGAGRCVHHDLKRIGWARAKGLVKENISANIKNMPRTEFGQGVVDAYLDSVGC